MKLAILGVMIVEWIVVAVCWEHRTLHCYRIMGFILLSMLLFIGFGDYSLESFLTLFAAWFVFLIRVKWDYLSWFSILFSVQMGLIVA